MAYNSRTKKSKDYWETPPNIFELLNKEFQFTLDAAASDDNHLCANYFTKEVDGLKQDWKDEIVFCNPPYNKKDDWIKKCYEERQKDNTIIVMLIPNGTETESFHKYGMKAYEIRLMKGRIEFLINGKKPDKSGNNRGSIIIIFKKHSLKYPRLRPFYHKEKDLLKFKDLWCF